ncbi:LppX_LprAFG lipoprotein [Nocardioides daejeonensis]|uniref:LppX_LprAFG lipoprotein n=1 Tax=Nocardioides daejeonensis TaxID=1046556 RepID=UPI000D744361|nr:LppX_LprAFG lipoprotein [Nocardioides daejeonensis]
MHSSVRRTLAAAAVAPLLVLTLVACGDKSKDDSASDPAASSSPSGDQSTGHDPGTETDGTETDGGVPEVDLPTGDIDPAAFAAVVEQGRSAVTTASVDLIADFDDDGGTGSGTLDLSGDRDALDLLLKEEGIDDSRFIFIDDVVYTKESDEPKYAKLTPEVTGTGDDGVSFFAFLHPYQLTGLVLDGATEVEHTGEEQVGGVVATRYRVTASNDALDKLFGGLLEESEKPKSTVEDLWLDPQGRLVKLVLTVVDSKAENTLTMTLGDFGKAPEVVEPPAAQVTELDSHLDLPDPEAAPRPSSPTLTAPAE